MNAMLSPVMTLAEFLASKPVARVKVISRKVGKTDWAALSPAKQAFDQRAKETA